LNKKLIIEFSETKWNQLTADDAIDIIQWIVSHFDHNYEMRKCRNSDLVHFIGESSVFPDSDGSIYVLSNDCVSLVKTDRHL